MAKLTKDQMSAIIKYYNQVILKQPQDVKMKLADTLNQLMRDQFGNPITEDYMFGFENYDCWISFNQFNIQMKRFENALEVSYHRRLVNNSTGNNVPAFCHKKSFADFCYENLNPLIITILQKALFEIM